MQVCFSFILHGRVSFVTLPDLVIWDSHPLALGATPKQVYIDGIAQIEFPYVVEKPNSLQCVPRVPNFDSEALKAVEYEGLPPLFPAESYIGDVLFKNVMGLFLPDAGGDHIQDAFTTQGIHSGVVMVINGTVACFGPENSCSMGELTDSRARPLRIIDLEGGSIGPTLVSYGSPLGLSEIQGEISTGDGTVFDPLVAPVPLVAEQVLVRAVDGLQFAGRDALFVLNLLFSHTITHECNLSLPDWPIARESHVPLLPRATLGSLEVSVWSFRSVPGTNWRKVLFIRT